MNDHWLSSKVTFKVGNRKDLIYDEDHFLREIYNSVKVAKKRISSHVTFKLENNLESIKMEVISRSSWPMWEAEDSNCVILISAAI